MRLFCTKKAQSLQGSNFGAYFLTFCTSHAPAPFGTPSFRVDRSAEKSGLNQPKAQ
jgi:hypothetical protein